MAAAILRRGDLFHHPAYALPPHNSVSPPAVEWVLTVGRQTCPIGADSLQHLPKQFVFYWPADRRYSTTIHSGHCWRSQTHTRRFQERKDTPLRARRNWSPNLTALQKRLASPCLPASDQTELTQHHCLLCHARIHGRLSPCHIP